jgi:hypothetical protein
MPRLDRPWATSAATSRARAVSPLNWALARWRSPVARGVPTTCDQADGAADVVSLCLYARRHVAVTVAMVGGGPWEETAPHDSIGVSVVPPQGVDVDLIVGCNANQSGYVIESPSLWGSSSVGWDHRAAVQRLIENGAPPEEAVEFRARCRANPDRPVPESEPNQSCFRE